MKAGKAAAARNVRTIVSNICIQEQESVFVRVDEALKRVKVRILYCVKQSWWSTRL